ncbi:MAG: OmpA family protein [Nitrospiraceae bacterium]|nr:OmpA family protein [Nitrospiraceae bacterium]
MRKFVLAFFITVLVPAIAFASEIRQMPYAYPFEFAASPVEPAFVICDGCLPRKAPVLALAPRPIPPQIVIRVSGPLPAKTSPAPAQPAPVGPVQAGPASAKSPLKLPVCGEEGESREAPKPVVVHFAFDSYALRPGEKAKLKVSTSLFKGPVSVTGYTDDIGTPAYNMRLSLDRAETVARFLRRIGVIPATITGKGECCLFSNIKKLNRRVEIKEVR